MPLFGPPNVEKLKAKRNIKGLIKALSWRGNVADSAVEVLVEIGESAAEPLVAAINRRGVYHHKAEEALVKMGTPAVKPLTVALLESKDVVKRRAVAELLRKIGDSGAVDSLIMALHDVDSEVRKRAAQALGEIGDAKAVQPLIQVLKRDSSYWGNVRVAAAEALGQIGDTRAVEALRGAQKSKQFDVQQAASEALVTLGHRPAAEVEEALAFERPPETGIKMLPFERWDAIGEHIVREINTISPDRVLIIGADSRSSKSLVEQLEREAGLYEVWYNESCSLRWLCHTVERIRGEEKKVILLSNFPREIDPPTTHFLENDVTPRTVTMPKGTSLSLCGPRDQTTKISVFLIGAYAIGYCDRVYRSQATGREDKTQFQVLVPLSDWALLDSEIRQLKACSSETERQRMLWQITQKLERDPNTPPAAYSGGILLA